MTRKQDLPRVQRLRQMHSIALMNMSARPGMPTRFLKYDGATFDHAVAIDPTPKAIYLNTIIRWYRSGVLRYEDARQVREILSAFHERKHELPMDQRDIGQYKTPGDLSEVMGLLGDQVFVDVPEEVLSASPVVASGSGWAIHRISDIDAAEWWADSTDWCTRHPETAKEYLEHGDLFVVNSLAGKLQFHVKAGQLMDRYDREVSPALPGLPDDCLHAIREVVRSAENLRPASLELKIDTALMSRGKPTTPLYDAMHGLSTRHLEEAMVSSNGSLVYPELKLDETGIHAIRLDSTRHTRTLAREVVDELDKDSPVFEYIRDAVQEITRGNTADKLHIITPWHALRDISRWLWKNTPVFFVASIEGHDLLVWKVMPEHGIQGYFEAVDIDGPAGGRAFRFASADELETMPYRFTKAVHMTVDIRHLREADIMQVVDVKKLPATIAEPWRTTEGQQRVISLLLRKDRGGINRLAVAALGFDAEKAGALARLSSRMWISDDRARAIPTNEPVDLADLDVVIDIENAGLLLAGVPDEVLSDDIVDRFIRAGRTESIGVLPSDYITYDRIHHLYSMANPSFRARNGTNLSAVGSSRVISVKALKTITDVRNASGRGTSFGRSTLGGFISRYIVYKGGTIIKENYRFHKAFREVAVNADLDIIVATIDKTGQREALNEIFDGVPPVGCPWTIALEKLKVSADGLQDVLFSIKDRHWGDKPEERMAQLLAIPHIAQAIDEARPNRRLVRSLKTIGRILGGRVSGKSRFST